MDPVPPSAQGLTPTSHPPAGQGPGSPRFPKGTMSHPFPDKSFCTCTDPWQRKWEDGFVQNTPNVFTLQGLVGPVFLAIIFSHFSTNIFSLKNAQKFFGLFFFIFFQLSCAWNPVFSKCMAEQLSVTWRITNIISAHDFVYIVCGKMVEFQRCLSDVRHFFLWNFVVETRPFW